MSVVEVDTIRNRRYRCEKGRRRNHRDFDGVDYPLVDEALVTTCSEFDYLMESFKFHNMINLKQLIIWREIRENI